MRRVFCVGGLFVDWCSIFVWRLVGCCSWLIVRCLLFVGCWFLLFVDRALLFRVCCFLFVVC